MKRCPDCDTEKPLSEFYKNKARYDGVQSVCKLCIGKRTSKWYEANKEFHNEYMRQHSRKNRWMYNARDSKRRAAELQATPPWANTAQIKRIYQACQNITERTGVQHHVDHVIPLQGKNVCGLHTEKNLAIIPAKMNISKANKFGPDDNVVGSSKTPAKTGEEK